MAVPLTGGKGEFKSWRIRKANRNVSVVIRRIMIVLLKIKAFLKYWQTIFNPNNFMTFDV